MIGMKHPKIKRHIQNEKETGTIIKYNFRTLRSQQSIISSFHNFVYARSISPIYPADMCMYCVLTSNALIVLACLSLHSSFKVPPVRAKPYLVKAPPGLFETDEIDIGGSLTAYSNLVNGLKGKPFISKETLFDNSGNVADMKPKMPPHFPKWYPLKDMEIPSWNIE